jgi:hypothetical protein
VITAGTLTWLDCDNTPQSNSYGIGPLVIGGCIKPDTWGGSAVIDFETVIYGPCCSITTTTTTTLPCPTPKEYNITNSGNFYWKDCTGIDRYDYFTTGTVLCICNGVDLPVSLNGGTGTLEGGGCEC